MDFELKIEVRELPIGELVENRGQIPDVPKNPRKISKERFDALCESIRTSPEMKVLDEVRVFKYDGKYVVIGGNHRFRAYKTLGWKNVLCKVLPDDTPKEKLREYVIKDNMQYAENDTKLLSEWDVKELAAWDLIKIDSELTNEKKDISSNFDFEYRVEIACKDEAEQEKIYNEMRKRGYECRILIL